VLRLILALLGLAVAAAAVVWLADHPGSVRIAWLGYQVELSAALTLGFLLTVAVVVAALARLWRWLRTRPAALREDMARRRRRRADAALTSALVALAWRDPSAALAALKRLGAAHPVLASLVRAAAARLSGDGEGWRQACEQLRATSDMAALGRLGLAETAWRDGDTAAARALLEEAERAAPGDRLVLVRRFALESAAGNWPEAQAALERLAKIKGIERARIAAARADLLAREALALIQAGDADTARARAGEAVKAGPERLWPALIAAELDAAAGARPRARKRLVRAWKAAPHPVLAQAFAGLEPGETALERLRRFETFTQETADHPESHIALAEQAIAAGMWGLARSHLNAVLGTAASARALHLAAELVMGETGDDEAARRWRRLATHCGDSAWACEVCGLRQANWRPDCPACATLASLVWTPAPPARFLPGLRLTAPAGVRAPDEAKAGDPGADIYRTLAAGEARDAAERAGDASDD